MGLGEVVESALEAHDGDGDVGQAREVARQVCGVHPAPVLVVGDVAHVVDSVLDAPVPSDQGQDSFGAGVLEGQRGQSMDGLVVYDAGLSVPSLALDAERDPAMGELGLVGVGFGAQVDDPARAFLNPPVSFVLGTMLGGADLGSLPVQTREVGEQREPIGLHRRHDVVRLAMLDQMPCGVVLGMQGIDGDDPSGQGEPGGQGANGGDFVALVRDRFLSEDESAAVLGGGDEEVLRKRRLGPTLDSLKRYRWMALLVGGSVDAGRWTRYERGYGSARRGVPRGFFAPGLAASL